MPILRGVRVFRLVERLFEVRRPPLRTTRVLLPIPELRMRRGAGLGHLAWLHALGGLLFRRVLVEVRFELGAVLVERERVPESADRAVRCGEW